MREDSATAQIVPSPNQGEARRGLPPKNLASSPENLVLARMPGAALLRQLRHPRPQQFPVQHARPTAPSCVAPTASNSLYVTGARLCFSLLLLVLRVPVGRLLSGLTMRRSSGLCITRLLYTLLQVFRRRIFDLLLYTSGCMIQVGYLAL